MEVVVPSPPPPMDFNFHSAYSSPYTTAPSSPQRLNTSSSSSSSSSTIPFNWEEKPGTPRAKSKENEVARDDFGEEFEFDFSGQLDRASLSADELFDKGRIRPLKPPPGYYEHASASRSSSPKSPSSRSLLGKKKESEFDPFQAAFEETRRKDERGREAVRTSSVRKKGNSRSLSPLRVTDILFDEKITETSTKPSSSIFSALSFSSYRKWKLKDLLLFRSASEGSGSSRIISTSSGSREGSMGKYVALSKKELSARDDVKNSSFRSSEGSVGGVSRRRLSSAELHYTANRAVAEEMRRKTPLPYKQGLLGCLGFNYHHSPSVHELSRGIGSLARGR